MTQSTRSSRKLPAANAASGKRTALNDTVEYGANGNPHRPCRARRRVPEQVAPFFCDRGHGSLVSAVRSLASSAGGFTMTDGRVVSEADVITKLSPQSVRDTAAKLAVMISAKGMKLFAVIDQAAE